MALICNTIAAAEQPQGSSADPSWPPGRVCRRHPTTDTFRRYSLGGVTYCCIDAARASMGLPKDAVVPTDDGSQWPPPPDIECVYLVGGPRHGERVKLTRGTSALQWDIRFPRSVDSYFSMSCQAAPPAASSFACDHYQRMRGEHGEPLPIFHHEALKGANAVRRAKELDSEIASAERLRAKYSQDSRGAADKERAVLLRLKPLRDERDRIAAEHGI